MGQLLNHINAKLKGLTPMGECAAISECRDYAGRLFYVASIYLWANHPRPSAEMVAGWFKAFGCTGVSVAAVLHEEGNQIAHGQGKHGEFPWEVSFSMPEGLAGEPQQPEKASVESLDDGIGYKGQFTQVFAIGPRTAMTVPCGCEGDCDWCNGSGWVTPKVKELRDTLGRPK